MLIRLYHLKRISFIISTLILFTLKTHSADSNFVNFSLNEIKNELLLKTLQKKLSKPAGKFGFLKVNNNNFHFENKKNIKFYGTNLCYESCFPDKEYALKIAKIIASFGFNAVRFHHMDSYKAPKGIFQDITLTELSKTQLEKLDFFIYALKEEGIYINLNLLVHRSFENNPNVPENKKLKKAAKPVSLFDDNIINEQKKYAKDLLTHFNPFTKLRYIDDPSIILIELINETSLIRDFLNDKLHFFEDGSGIPKYYSDSLDEKWAKWLKSTHPRIPFFKRPRFNKKNNLIIYNYDLLYEFYIHLQNQYFIEMQNFLTELGVKIPIIGIGGYIENEDLKSMKNLDVYDTHYYIDHPIFLKNKSWNKNSFYLKSKSNIPGKLDDFKKRLKILNKDKKAVTVTEWNHCYPSPFAYETPVLFAFTAKKNNVDAIFQFTFLDTLDSFFDKNGLQSYFNLFGNPQQLILHMISSIIFSSNEKIKLSYHKNYYIIEGNSIMAIIGNLKDETADFGDYHFKFYSYGAFIALKLNNKNIAVFSFSEITNTNAHFNNDGTFNWGSPPLNLKHLPYSLQNTKSKKIKISSINDSLKPTEILLKDDNYFNEYKNTDYSFVIVENH